MTFVEIGDAQLESWNEKDGVGQATFKDPVPFVKLYGKFSPGILYRNNRYNVTWVSVDRKNITFRRTEPREKRSTTLKENG